MKREKLWKVWLALYLLMVHVYNKYHRYYITVSRKIYCARSAPIRESVDSLCRDGADTPIVRVYTKAF